MPALQTSAIRCKFLGQAFPLADGLQSDAGGEDLNFRSSLSPNRISSGETPEPAREMHALPFRIPRFEIYW